MKWGWDHTVTPKEENFMQSKIDPRGNNKKHKRVIWTYWGLFTDNMEVLTFRDRMERFYRFFGFRKELSPFAFWSTGIFTYFKRKFA